MEQHEYKGILIQTNLSKTTANLSFLTEKSTYTNDVWNDILKILCRKTTIIGEPEYDPKLQEFKIQVKTIKKVEDAIELCEYEPEFKTANLYINGEHFKFKYIQRPIQMVIGGKKYNKIGEFILPKSVYEQFLNQ